MILVLSMVEPSWAWECWDRGLCGCEKPIGNSVAYHINTNDFTSAGADEIELGGWAWNAGSSTFNRGALWNFGRGSDTTSDGDFGDSVNNVRKKPDSWFGDQGLSSDVIAVTANTLVLCGRTDSDITFRGSVTWSTGAPSEITTGNPSIGQTAEHEFGHVLGLDHEYDNISVMNPDHPFGGDIAGQHFRLDEDSYVGLTNQKPDSNTGDNLMLSVFQWDAGPPIDFYEGWTSNWVYDKSLAAWVGQAGEPEQIQAIIDGTDTLHPLIEWRVATNTCFDGVGTEYTVGTRTPGISSNLPYVVGPNSWDFSSVPVGNTYHLCAMINSDYSLSELSYVDDVIQSDALVDVVP